LEITQEIPPEVKSVAYFPTLNGVYRVNEYNGTWKDSPE
jgi:hypothetical protein